MFKLVYKTSPRLLISFDSFCHIACQNANFDNGLFCWSYTYTGATNCYLHFYNKPLEITHPEEVGKSPGTTIMLRSCTDRKFFLWNVHST